MGSLRSVIRNGVLDRLSWGNEVRLKKIFRILSDPLYFKNYRRYGLIGDEVRIDASTRCQLKCPICPTATGENRERPLGWGDLSFEHFKQFVDRYPGIRKIELSNWGEIFLNPEIGEIIRYGYEKGIELSAVNGVNLNTVKEEVLEALVKYRFRAMTVSLDGATNESYRQYRVNGNLDKVLENIKRINRYKEQYGSPYPTMVWQFIIFGHNEHEIGRARRMAEELGMSFLPKLNAYTAFSPIKDKEAVMRESGLEATSRMEYKEKKKRYYGIPCSQLWFSPQINWDGKLMGCCVNGWKDFGNVFESGLAECMKGEKIEYARQMLLGKKGPREDIACSTCPYYRRDEAFMFQQEAGADAPEAGDTGEAAPGEGA